MNRIDPHKHFFTPPPKKVHWKAYMRACARVGLCWVCAGSRLRASRAWASRRRPRRAFSARALACFLASFSLSLVFSLSLFDSSPRCCRDRDAGWRRGRHSWGRGPQDVDAQSTEQLTGIGRIAPVCVSTTCARVDFSWVFGWRGDSGTWSGAVVREEGKRGWWLCSHLAELFWTPG